jgi:hypothetical protein
MKVEKERATTLLICWFHPANDKGKLKLSSMWSRRIKKLLHIFIYYYYYYTIYKYIIFV